jgi:hypothetical protein
MINNEQIISKGVYGFSQISDFISVKNYIFIRKEDKLCLAIRFFNDTEYTFDSMSFCVIQLNALGKVIARTRIEYNNMQFESGKMYTSNNLIVVDGECVDFRIQFYEAYSDYYRYVVKNRRVVVYYDRHMAEKFARQYASVSNEEYLSVKKKVYGKAKLSVLAAVIAILIMFGFNIYYLFALYADTFPDGKIPGLSISNAVDEEESLRLGVEYAET